jgi:hypothetical protein
MRFGNGTGPAEEVDGFDLGVALIEWCRHLLFVLRSMVDEQLLCEAMILVRRCCS